MSDVGGPGPSTLLAAVPPPPEPPSSIGAQLGIPAAPDSIDDNTPPSGISHAKSGASVDMDWEDEEESTHVFENRRHRLGLLARSGEKSAGGAPAKVGAAAALLAGSGGAAGPRSVPPPAAAPASLPPAAKVEPTPALPPAPPVPAIPSMPPASEVSSPSIRRTVDEPTVVRARDNSGRLGLIMGSAALLAVGGLVAWMMIPKNGELKIQLKAKSGQPIAKAEIFVDGQKYCDTTPCRVANLEAGKKSVKIIAPGLPIVEESVPVEAGKEKLVTIDVDDSTAAVVATAPPVTTFAPTAAPTPASVAAASGFKVSGPSSVKVFVDGVERGTLPLTVDNLAPGTHKLRFDGGDKFESKEREIVVESGRVADLGAVELTETKPTTPAPTPTTPTPPATTPTATAKTPPKDPPKDPAPSGNGTLNINSIPVSKVVLDGRPLGNTPQAGISVSAGSHTVTFIHPEKGRKSVTVTVKPGQKATASVKF